MYASENQMIVEDALTRIDSILEKKPLTEAAGKADPKDMSITFENVSFRYEDAAKDALHNINLKIREGEHVAFVGPSGGGKSTLASLIARFFDATEGRSGSVAWMCVISRRNSLWIWCHLYFRTVNF